MPDDRPLYEKFLVSRTDGRSKPGEKHELCSYFVLDIDCDRHAIPAMEAYAKDCEENYPALAKDLMRLVNERRAGEALRSSMGPH